MPSKYKRLIGDYCAQHGIAVPSGFGRNTPGRYLIIRTHLTPPKLIATTWFKTADVHYYIEQFLYPEFGEALPESIRILDFQEGEELSYSAGKRFDRVATFPVTNQNEAAS
jgi:hypothetical protein